MPLQVNDPEAGYKEPVLDLRDGREEASDEAPAAEEKKVSDKQAIENRKRANEAVDEAEEKVAARRAKEAAGEEKAEKGTAKASA